MMENGVDRLIYLISWDTQKSNIRIESLDVKDHSISFEMKKIFYLRIKNDFRQDNLK